MSYFPLSLTTTTSSRPKAKRKSNTFHGKTYPCRSETTEKCMALIRDRWRSRPRLRSGESHAGAKQPHKRPRHGHCLSNVFIFHFQCQISTIFRTALSWENELGQITNPAWFDLFAHEELKKWAPVVRNKFHIGLQVPTVLRDIDSFNRYRKPMVNYVDICTRGIWDSISFYISISFYRFH